MKIIKKVLFGFAFCTSVFAVSSCDKIQDDLKPEDKANLKAESKKGEVVYIQSNNFLDGKNSIIAYRNQGDGKLEQIEGSPFLTKGDGYGNPDQIVGPADQDTPVIIYDGRFLLAVNGGSNTIAVFKIMPDGALECIPGSPFPSGGKNPVSLATCDKYLYVINKNQDPLHPANEKPNYRTLKIHSDGSLSIVPDGIYEVNMGASPAQALVSYNQKFLFGADFLNFMQTPPLGTLRSFKINSSGLLTPVAGTPQIIPEMGGALGLWQHPKANTLYVGFPMAGKIGIYKINETSGALTFNSSITAGAANCWIRTTKSGEYLYTLNTAENTISVFNSINSLVPTTIEKFPLKNSGPFYSGPMNAQFPTSQPFHLSFSPSEKYLYVLNQHTNKDFNIGNFNYLHVLHVAADGKLTEPAEPIQVPVASNVRPIGVAVY